jgi:hypothetical protein
MRCGVFITPYKTDECSEVKCEVLSVVLLKVPVFWDIVLYTRVLLKVLRLISQSSKLWVGKCHLSVKSVKLYSLLYKILILICTFTTVLEVWRSSCSRTTFQWFASKEGYLHSLIGCRVLASHLICYELEQRELGPDCRVDRGEVPTYFSEFSLHTHKQCGAVHVCVVG